MKALNAGDLRHRISFQTRADVPNAFGELTPTWTTLATVWAKVEPLTGKDLQLLLTMGGAQTHRITCRYYPGIVQDGTMRIQFVDVAQVTHTYTISNVANIEQRNYQLVISATEDVRK